MQIEEGLSITSLVRIVVWIGLKSIAIACLGCASIPEDSEDKKPLAVERGQIHEVIRSIPSDNGLVFSGISFFDNNLLVTSNIGVFKISNDGSTRLFKWRSEDDVVSGPWFDRSSDRAWFFHSGLIRFFVYDGNIWESVEFPIKEPSRADLIYGLNGQSNQHAFWIQPGMKSSWRWNKSSNYWSQIELPDIKCMDYLDGSDSRSCFAAFAPTDNFEYVIMHNELISPGIDIRRSNAQRPRPDRVFVNQDSGWTEIKKTNDRDFIAKLVVTTPSNVYLLSHFGPVFQINENGIENIGSPGDVGAMTGSSDGKLIVSVPHVGVFEYRDRWKKLFSSPYDREYPIQFEYLAIASEGLAFAAVPRMKTGGPRTAKSRLWKSEGDELVEVTIP